MNGLTISHNLINQLLNRASVLALQHPTTLTDSNQSAMNIMHNDNTFPLNVHIEVNVRLATLTWHRTAKSSNKIGM